MVGDTQSTWLVVPVFVVLCSVCVHFFLSILRCGMGGMWHITAAAKNNIFGDVCSLFRHIGVDKILAGVRIGEGVSNWAFLLHIGEGLLFLGLFSRYSRTKSSCFYNAVGLLYVRS